MAIADFVLPTMEVQTPDGKTIFAVRGLSLDDVAALVAVHGPVMETFFTKYQGIDVADADSMAIGMELLGKAPALVANVIAVAADEPKLWTKVLKMPVAIQMDALQKIGKLSFDASGGPGNFFGLVKQMVVGMTGLMGNLNPSQNG